MERQYMTWHVMTVRKHKCEALLSRLVYYGKRSIHTHMYGCSMQHALIMRQGMCFSMVIVFPNGYHHSRLQQITADYSRSHCNVSRRAVCYILRSVCSVPTGKRATNARSFRIGLGQSLRLTLSFLEVVREHALIRLPHAHITSV